MKQAESNVTVDVRAVDVGYFSTKVSLGRKIVGNESVISTSIFPSLAPRLPSNMSMASALQSKPDGTVVSVDGVNYFVGRDASLYSSGREPREVLPDYSRTEKYKALLLGAFHYIAADAQATETLTIRQLVLGLPLDTFSAHREALTALCTGAHTLPDPTNQSCNRTVVVQKTSVIVQPQGALMNYGVTTGSLTPDGWALVIDPGGGTLDWYLARGRHTNWQRSGAYPKSMLACAYSVADRIDPTWRDNFEIIERIDRSIRTKQPSFTTAGEVYNLEDFRSEIEAVLKESVEKMIARVGSFDNLDKIIFTGGGAVIFRDFFVERFPRLNKIISMDKDSVYSNVKGFQIAGEIISGPRN